MINKKKEFDTIKSFGEEWTKFDQSKEDKKNLYKIFKKYFIIFPWKNISKKSVGFDMGCGSGRWAQFVAPKVRTLNCIDPSKAIKVAKKELKKFKNIVFHKKTVDKVKLKYSSQDFGYSLGVLHHISDTQSAIISCVKLLKPGAPFLIYLYYAFDNRPIWFIFIWKISDLVRRILHVLPESLKNFLTDTVALVIYWPLARSCRIFEYLNLPINNFPLSFYRKQSFYMMRTDSRDRLGTPIEQRFKKNEIYQMMKSAQLTNIKFSKNEPFWCAIGYKSCNSSTK